MLGGELDVYAMPLRGDGFFARVAEHIRALPLVLFAPRAALHAGAVQC